MLWRQISAEMIENSCSFSSCFGVLLFIRKTITWPLLLYGGLWLTIELNIFMLLILMHFHLTNDELVHFTLGIHLYYMLLSYVYDWDVVELCRRCDWNASNTTKQIIFNCQTTKLKNWVDEFSDGSFYDKWWLRGRYVHRQVEIGR